MASEFSKEFARKHLETDVTVGAARLMTNLDESLQEVRDVLEALMTRKWFGDKPTTCWCDPRAYPDSDEDADHDARCQRARALWAKLEVK